jgi:hypothetical protein
MSILPTKFELTVHRRGDLIRQSPHRAKLDVNGINFLDRLEARHAVWILCQVKLRHRGRRNRRRGMNPPPPGT